MTNGDTFYVYVPTTLRALMRGWYGEGRAHNLQRIRDAVHGGIRNALALYEEAKLVNTASIHPSESQREVIRFRGCALMRQHVRMCEALENARGGIAHLLQTYRDDASSASQVTLILKELDEFADARSSLTASSSVLVIR